MEEKDREGEKLIKCREVQGMFAPCLCRLPNLPKLLNVYNIQTICSMDENDNTLPLRDHSLALLEGEAPKVEDSFRERKLRFL